MKNPLLKKLLPHFIAIIIFLIVSVLFCKPVLEGNVLNQSDITGWKGMAQNAFEYKTIHGHFPLWNPNLFSGMPNYQVAMEGKSVLPDLSKIFTLGLPKPINFFFLACITFYILCVVFGVNTVIAIAGSLAYAFATYNAIIIGVGHESKMWAIAYMPALLAGLILIYEKKYWIGLALTTVAAYLEVAVNHPQINYYFFLVAAAVTIVYVIKWIKEKDWIHFAKSVGIAAIAAIAGIAACSVTLLTNNEYVKATMRGGKDVSIEGSEVKATKTSGLDTAYAFQYSLGKAETFVIMMPNAFGGGNSHLIDENSNAIKKLIERGVPENQAMQAVTMDLPKYLGVTKYWGGIDGVGTAGPPYLGIVICLLGLLGFILVKNPVRWGLLLATLFGIMLAWGKYLPGFNTFLFNHLPLYNKFRAPSMAMVITELTIPTIAVLGLQNILYREKSKELLKADFRKILYTFGGLFGILIVLYLMMGYSFWMDPQIVRGFTDKSGNDEFGRLIVAGLKADRKAMFGGQILRSLAFAAIVIGILYIYMRNWIKPVVVSISFGLISTIDLIVIDKGYLTEENYAAPTDIASQNFTPTAIDKQIMQDKTDHGDFRVFNTTENPYMESRTSYFFKSIGGYHPAKLRIYQDIIDRYLSGPFNQNVLNMLNAKYWIKGNQQTGQISLDTNHTAFGPCWLVKNVKLVNDNVEEIQSIGNADLKDTAFVEKLYANNVTQPQWDSSSYIRLTKFDNDTMEYYASCKGSQFAAFSEVYYPYGWNVYIDGKRSEYVRTNYILRGLSIPSGNHNIKFIFEPATYKKGVKIAYAASFFILIFFLGGIFMQWRTGKKRV